MRRLTCSALMAMLALVVTGCATTMSVSSYVERGLDFTQYRTYEWGPADALPTGDPRLDRNPFFQDQMQGAVEKAFASRGLARATSGTPDLLIHYHANITNRIDVNRIDREQGYCYGVECQAGIVEYEAGTLVLDVVDARTKRVIWRGWARDGIEDALEDRDEMARQIDEAVTRMMQMYPGTF